MLDIKNSDNIDSKIHKDVNGNYFILNKLHKINLNIKNDVSKKKILGCCKMTNKYRIIWSENDNFYFSEYNEEGKEIKKLTIMTKNLLKKQEILFGQDLNGDGFIGELPKSMSVNNRQNIDINKNNINTNKNNISTNKINIATNKTNIDFNKQNITVNRKNIFTNKDNININKKNISSNKNNIDINRGNIATNKNNISTNKNNISTNKNNISTNKNNIAKNEKQIEINLEKNWNDYCKNKKKCLRNREKIDHILERLQILEKKFKK